MHACLKKLLLTALSLLVCTFTFSQSLSFTLFDTLMGRHYSSISSGDINADSIPDFLHTGVFDGYQQPEILRYSDTGFVVQTVLASGAIENGGTAIRDMNGDNIPDAVFNGTSRLLQVYQQQNTGSFNSSYLNYGTTPDGFGEGDYDNDGDIDVIAVGPHVSYQPEIYLFTNTGNGFVKSIPANVAPRKEGDAAFGDFDGDLDLDLIVTGLDSNNVKHADIYENVNGTFVFRDSLDGNHYSEIIIHDLNADGKEDILIKGRFNPNSAYTKPFLNQGNFNFSVPSNYPYFYMTRDGGITIGDVDSDGDIDVFLMAQGGNRFYLNDGNSNFTLSSEIFDTLDAACATLLDFEHDGDLDLVVSGYSHTISNKEAFAYKNNGTAFNTRPNAPTQLYSSWNGNDLTLIWNAGTDTQTDSSGLNYNIFLYNHTTGQFIVSPDADTATGYRYRNAAGNSGFTKGHLIKNLPAGQYSWGVQSVDNHFTGSVFQTISQPLCHSGTTPVIALTGNDSICSGDSVQLSITPVSGFTHQWYKNNDSITGSSMNNSIWIHQPDDYKVKFTNNSCSFFSATQTIATFSIPNPVLQTTAINNGFCPNDTVLLYTNGNYSQINWFRNGVAYGNSDTISISTVGTYQLLATDSSGLCLNDTSGTGVQMVQHALPTVSLPAFNPICENASPLTLNTGTPAGGTYSGTGISNTTFSPSVAGTGNQSIFYNYTNSNGCSASDTNSILVDFAPVTGSISGDSSICIGDSTTLTVNGHSGTITQWLQKTSGNNWTTLSGTGTTTTVHPSATTQYAIVISNGSCAPDTSAPYTVQVHTLPLVQLPALNTQCMSNAPVNLNGTPAGGTYSGNGVSGNQFAAQVAGNGTHSIVYHYTDLHQCKASDTILVQVDSISVAGNISGLDSLCTGENATLQLTGHNGTPTWWSKSGSGNWTNFASNTLQNTVTPNVTTSYRIITTNGACPADTTSIHTLTVDSTPNIQFSVPGAICHASPVINLNASPTGGTFSGSGITNNQLNPASVTIGNHYIIYSVTSSAGCSASDSTLIQIDAVSNSGSFIQDSIEICENSNAQVNLSGYGGNITHWQYAIQPYTTWTTIVQTDSFYLHNSANSAKYRVLVKNGVCPTDTSAVAHIIVHDNPVVQFNDSALCQNSGTLALSSLATPIGGTFTGTHVNGSNFSTSTAGSFTLNYQFTDTNNCSAANTAQITVHGLPIVSYDSTFNVCASTALVNLGSGSPANGTFSGTGVTGTTWNTATSGTGNFSITYAVTDNNGCTNSDSSTISISPVPVAGAISGTDTLCIGDSTVLSATGYTGSSLAWQVQAGSNWTTLSSTADSIIVSPASTSQYRLIVGSNNCAPDTTVPFQVVINNLPSISISPTGPVCALSNGVTLAATPTGGVFSGVGVSGNQFSASTTGVGNHQVNYQYTDINGCVNSDSIFIQVDSLSVAGILMASTDSICSGDSTLLNLNGYNGAIHDWLSSVDNGNTWNNNSIVMDSLQHTSATTTLYKTIVKNGVCPADTSNTVQILINTLPALSFNDTSICKNNGSIQLNDLVAPTGGTFSGSQVSGTLHSSNTPGTYPIIYSYTDTNGCSNTANAAITINDLPTVTYDSIFSICHGTDTVALGAGTPANGTFSGTGVSGNNWLTATSGQGNFDVIYSYTDTNGCSNQDTGKITIHAPVSVSIGDTFYLKDSIVLTAGSFHSYLWNTGANTSSITVQQEGTYSVQVWDTNGCTGEDSVLILLSSVKPIDQAFSIEVYPNPAKENIYLSGEQLKTFKSVNILSIHGISLIEKTLDRTSEAVLDIRSLPPGNYIMLLSDEQDQSYSKLILIR